MKLNNKRAWVEAIVDTIFALLMNFPLNIVMLWICSKMELTILQTSITMSSVFTVVAVVRKYLVRDYCSKQ